METSRLVPVTALALAMWAAAGHAQQDAKALQVMTDVRKAIGGEEKLAAVKALSLRGTYQREMTIPPPGAGGRADFMIGGPGGPAGPPGGPPPQITGDLELDVEIPSKYIRVDTSTGFMGMTRTEGFDGDRPFAHAAAANPGMRIRIDNPAEDPALAARALERHRAEVARLLLGVLGSTPSSFPVTYRHAGVAESADGRADVIEIQGRGGFAARLFVDVQTHLPLMLTYMAAEPRMVLRTVEPGRPGAGAEREAAGAPEDTAPGKPVEHRLYFSDHRDVGGLRLPHRIARGVGQKTSEEWEIKSYKINPTFKADRFRVS